MKQLPESFELEITKKDVDRYAFHGATCPGYVVLERMFPRHFVDMLVSMVIVDNSMYKLDEIFGILQYKAVETTGEPFKTIARKWKDMPPRNEANN